MNFWYQTTCLAKLIAYLLYPFSKLFGYITAFRRFAYRQGWFKSWQSPCPIIVVGNLTVGGNGKTPVVIHLAQQCQARRVKVAIISRGYGGKSKYYPLEVFPTTDPNLAGDEPVLIAQQTGVPVAVSPNRRHSIELLWQKYQPQLIISDDGLQHYALRRDAEIVVVDSQREFGNGFLLPAGGLRELPSRLKQVDCIIYNGEKAPTALPAGLCADQMQLIATEAINLVSREIRPLNTFQQITAIAGIGNPDRFFNMLQQKGLFLAQTQAFADHHAYTAKDFSYFSQDLPLLMTEKDAVKCNHFSSKNWWYVPVTAQIKGEQLSHLIEKFCSLTKTIKEQ
ncbi:tetraacyldisaccharide 4'-kinase [Mergibacter septicus]|uniref:tetraacyldisaccharide 4'-kinase n=1 Tax=Mergibacter septicus TaxID=221402 RepID=UPI0011793142|nr:tetraacyldisaccharide 4'-kinase [Mergibacter septicus]AWX13133.1 tetraacyldisaccharide 4'-kinase [Mergibacter septicus]